MSHVRDVLDLLVVLGSALSFNLCSCYICQHIIAQGASMWDVKNIHSISGSFDIMLERRLKETQIFQA